MTSRLLPAAAAAATGIFVGSTIVATRFVIDQTNPVSLALLRYLIGFFCLLPPVLVSTRVRFARRDLLPVALLGITQFGIVVTLLNYALQFIPSARAALIFATFPLMTMILAIMLGLERATPAKVAGVLLTIVGVGFALGEGVLSQSNQAGEWAGNLAAFGSALSGAICSVFYRPYLRKYPTVQVSAFAMFASVVFLAVLAAGAGFFTAYPSFDLTGWLAVAFIGISSGIGYYLWLWALGHTSPTNATVFLALSPITATGLGILFLSESISVTFLLGLICVALGLWLATRQSRHAPQES